MGNFRDHYLGPRVDYTPYDNMLNRDAFRCVRVTHDAITLTINNSAVTVIDKYRSLWLGQ